ncbi:hypothetical protein L1887_52065 [Cichorium endivia]|nr:hypothetical protein L1887_52065 [Cichorium endivia]
MASCAGFDLSCAVGHVCAVAPAQAVSGGRDELTGSSDVAGCKGLFAGMAPQKWMMRDEERKEKKREKRRCEG